MKITIEHESHKIIVENEDVQDICDALDLVEQALLKIGYEPPRIKGGFRQKVLESGEDESRNDKFEGTRS